MGRDQQKPPFRQMGSGSVVEGVARDESSTRAVASSRTAHPTTAIKSKERIEERLAVRPRASVRVTMQRLTAATMPARAHDVTHTYASTGKEVDRVTGHHCKTSGD